MGWAAWTRCATCGASRCVCGANTHDAGCGLRHTVGVHGMGSLDTLRGVWHFGVGAGVWAKHTWVSTWLECMRWGWSYWKGRDTLRDVWHIEAGVPVCG